MKTVTITKCDQCPHRERVTTERHGSEPIHSGWCSLEGKSLAGLPLSQWDGLFPAFCPLEDAKEPAK